MTSIQVMLAATAKNIGDLSYPVLASPKLDGIRAVILDGTVMSRNMKPIPNASIQNIFGHPEYNGLDGELIVGRAFGPNVFRSSTAVMARGGSPEATFHLFDDFLCGGSFELRLRALAARRSKLRAAHLGEFLSIVPHTKIETPTDLLDFEKLALESGYEGVMIRDPLGAYKNGRSTLREGGLIKLKRFEDSEAVVVGFEEQLHNANEDVRDALGRAKRSTRKEGMVGAGKLGALVVEDLKTKARFNVGTGFDDAARVSLWEQRRKLPGLVVCYKFFPTGSKDLPRFPTFKGFRDAIDF